MDHDEQQQRTERGDEWVVRRPDGEALGIIGRDELNDAFARPGVHRILEEARRILAEERGD